MRKTNKGPMMTKALNHSVPGCDHFKRREILFLPRWRIYGIPRHSEIVENLCQVTFALDKIRKKFGKSISVTSGYRPEVYNALIGGAERSAHMDGMAIDFIVDGMDSDKVRALLRPCLKDLGIRMENLDTIHVHIDTRCEPETDNDPRYFKP
jgi:hypothetical protein